MIVVVIVVVIAVVFVLVAQSCLTFGDTTAAELPSLPLFNTEHVGRNVEVPTKHSVESQRFTKSVTKSLGI